MSNVEAITLAGVEYLPEDVAISYLPLAHSTLPLLSLLPSPLSLSSYLLFCVL